MSDALANGVAYLSINTQKPSEIRGKLEPASAPAGVKITSVDGMDPLRLYTIGSTTLYCGKKVDRCVVPLLAYSDKNGDCWVYTDIADVYVPKQEKPRIVWILVNRDVGDQHRYRFSPGGGIRITKNDPSKDFNDDDNDSWDDRRFKVKSVHGQAKSLSYRILVERYDESNDKPIGCLMADPTVTNE